MIYNLRLSIASHGASKNDFLRLGPSWPYIVAVWSRVTTQGLPSLCYGFRRAESYRASAKRWSCYCFWLDEAWERFLRVPRRRRWRWGQIRVWVSHLKWFHSFSKVFSILWGRHIGDADIPPLEKDISYTQVSAGGFHTVPLRTDGSAVACGRNIDGECSVQPLCDGMSYTQVSAGRNETLLLWSDGHAVACSFDTCHIPLLADWHTSGCLLAWNTEFFSEVVGRGFCLQFLWAMSDSGPGEFGERPLLQVSAGQNHTVPPFDGKNALHPGTAGGSKHVKTLGSVNPGERLINVVFLSHGGISNHPVVMTKWWSCHVAEGMKMGNATFLSRGLEFITSLIDVDSRPVGNDLFLQLDLACENDSWMCCLDLLSFRCLFSQESAIRRIYLSKNGVL